ncbi:cytochrome d ubiquinol oxidase subunit II [Paenibacillus sp. 481]|uniref:cytochrome d ubiquinol oxidase subunit II n=1 Tax=Paenibacillus sp. 481 TaxID=2835869 RepID=UPI001E39A81F|nr:cytochrome d ubiquinol oxidase subunit II [Paenibacillus sp. 481]UHA73163.1 cytochrome d ubiquinol oxidase subunit II [Paenibacillus sp. 481]
MLSLNEIWFIAIAVLFIGFFILEGFDFGVGIVSRSLGRTDKERRVLINTIGPFWHANQVWLITAGGAMFAAFPDWYATMFSGFYLPFVLLLLALIARGVAFEFRSQVENGTWKKVWDAAIFWGSILPPFLLGVTFANSIRGVQIDSQKELIGSVFELLNVYSLLGGVVVVLLCILHGLVFITIRTRGGIQDRARDVARKIVPAVAAVLILFVVLTYMNTDIYVVHGKQWLALPLLTGAALVFGWLLIRKQRDIWTFVMTTSMITLTFASIFIGLFPRLMVSSIDPAYSLTIFNAASGAYSLRLMTYMSFTIIPFIIGYQIWCYFVFRKPINENDHLEH